MAWDDIARQDHRRVCARYPSDMTDREWAIIAPLLPPARSGGRPRTVDLRAVVDAILFIASSGCQWRMLPKDFPPRSTVQGYFYAWRDSRLWETINQRLVMSARELEGREASPTAGVIGGYPEFRVWVGHDGWKGAQPCRDAKNLIFLMPSWTSCWLGRIPRRPLIRTAFSTA